LSRAEVGDGLEVGRKPTQQPHRLDVATAFQLQPARRTNLVEIAPYIELQQVARVVGGPPRRRRRRPAKTETRHIQTVNKGIDHPHGRIRCNIILKPRRQQRTLSPILANDIAHENGRTLADAAILPDLPRYFSHSLGWRACAGEWCL
jgi:hypothetical protein